jgi:hypothetical protein
MKSEIKKYQKLLEMQIQKSEYEKSKGFSGEKRLFHKPDESDDLSDFEED